MRIKVVGCGNAFSHENYNQSFLLEENGRTMLVDCGHRIPLALQDPKVNESIENIDDIYISHAHADHIGGLEEVAFTRYDWINRPRTYKDFGTNTKPPRLIANKDLLQNLWDKSLRGGLESMEGFVSNLSTFFEPVPVEPNIEFEWEGWKVDLIQQVHVMSGSVIMPSFGIMFKKDGHESLYIVTDSQHCSPRQIEDFYRKADIIIQDCECIGVLPETRRFLFGSGVHANYAQLAGYESANSIKLDESIKEKMWLSHYQDFVKYNEDFQGDMCSWDDHANKDGFKGFLEVGQELEI
jgi:ribonuclease BN (tRNA processing enzyme)